jgi:hypothetical protein
MANRGVFGAGLGVHGIEQPPSPAHAADRRGRCGSPVITDSKAVDRPLPRVGDGSGLGRRCWYILADAYGRGCAAVYFRALQHLRAARRKPKLYPSRPAWR